MPPDSRSPAPARGRTSAARGHPSDDPRIAVSVDGFRRILRELRIIARKTETATGLSAAQLFVLSTIADQPGASVNDIADATMTDRTSAAAVVERLVRPGFAVREQAPDDRRRAAISITPLGRRAMRRTLPPPTAVLVAGIRALHEGDRRALARGMTALVRAMGIADVPAGMLFDEPTRRSRPAAASTIKRNRARDR